MKQLAKLTTDKGTVWYLSPYAVNAICERSEGGCHVFISAGGTMLSFSEPAAVIAKRLEIPLLDRGNPIYDEPLAVLELCVRARHALAKAGITRVGTLVEKSWTDLFCLPNLGTTSIQNVREALGRHGLALRDEKIVEPPEWADRRA